MKKTYPSDEQDRFMVRMPEGMRAQIAEDAKSNGRSMNSEIVARLQATGGSAQEDLRTIRSQALEIANLRFEKVFNEGKIRELMIELATAARYLSRSQFTADPAVCELINAYIDYEPPPSKIDEWRDQMRAQLHAINSAMDGLKEAKSSPPDKDSK